MTRGRGDSGRRVWDMWTLGVGNWGGPGSGQEKRVQAQRPVWPEAPSGGQGGVACCVAGSQDKGTSEDQTLDP